MDKESVVLPAQDISEYKDDRPPSYFTSKG